MDNNENEIKPVEPTIVIGRPDIQQPPPDYTDIGNLIPPEPVNEGILNILKSSTHT